MDNDKKKIINNLYMTLIRYYFDSSLFPWIHVVNKNFLSRPIY